MTATQINLAFRTGVTAAKAAGALMRRHLSRPKNINSATQYDIKLELDVRSQKLIERKLAVSFPNIPILGEEDISGDVLSDYRWVVDPIDGTVNYAYGIPHACVCIALQRKRIGKALKTDLFGCETLFGITYDPFLDELWSAKKNQPARCNGKRIRVSQRGRLTESIITMGFSKKAQTISAVLPAFADLIPKVRKVRMFGSAGLSLAWIAAGRIDAYLEAGVRIWDVAAGALIIQQAGGEFWHRPLAGDFALELIASNGRLRKRLQRQA